MSTPIPSGTKPPARPGWQTVWRRLVGSEPSRFRQIERLHTLDERLLNDVGVGRLRPDFDAIRRKPIAFTQPW
jgi:hypothetical protein